MDGGGVLAALIADMRAEAEAAPLRTLIDACEETARHLLAADPDDRLAGSTPFLTMLSIAVCGWLMEKSARAAAQAVGDPEFLANKAAAARFYVEQVVPEALGLAAAATAPADMLGPLAG
jgi:hypothetical protein